MPYFLQRIAALAALVGLSPVMVAVTLVIRVVDGPPVIFRQSRIGRYENEFEILKFRSMVPDADSILAIDPSANRLTKTGMALRKSSLDELPQLVNVIRGEMALIGPRSVLPEVHRNMPSRFRARFDVLPGLTGLAQVAGRNDSLWSERLTADVEYVRRRSLLLDLKILCRTLLVLVRGTGFQPDRNTRKVDDLGLLARDT